MLCVSECVCACAGVGGYAWMGFVGLAFVSERVILQSYNVHLQL